MSFRLAVLASGSGSNLQALIDQQSRYGYQIACVLVNVPDVQAIRRAEQAGIAVCLVNHRDFDSREAFEQAMLTALSVHEIDLVVLAGFMRVLTPVFINAWAGRMINIHPSLLPLYKGLDTHARALAAGDQEHGASVHYVSSELDGGPVIAQVRVPVQSQDTPLALQQRVLAGEHQLLPAVVAGIAQGWISAEATRLPTYPLTLDQLLAKVGHHATV